MRRKTKRLSYIEQHGWLLIGKKPGLLSLNRSKKVWSESWSSMKKNLLYFYKDEESCKRNKHFKVVNVQNCEFYDATKRKKTPCCIRVIPKEKYKGKLHPAIYLQGENLRSIDELKLDLELNGGRFLGSYGQKEGGTKLEKTIVSDWKVTEVMEWLKILGFTKYQKVFKENKISGVLLVELDANLLESTYKVSREDAELLEHQITLLRKFLMFSNNRSVVQHKFRAFPLNEEESELPEVVDSLSDEAKIKHKFLSTADLRSHTLMGRKLKKSEVENARIQVDEEQLLQFEKFDTAKINIKLVVTEVMQNSASRKLKKVVSPVISAIMPNVSKKFQFFHTAIIVGPWYLEWTDSELIIPKRMVAGRAVISADVETLIVKKQGLKEIADKISEVVVRWNTRYKYRKKKSGDSVREKELMQGNCQEFVDDILKTLGIQQDFKGALGEFIQRMRVTGKCSLEFTACKEFKDFFDIDKKSMYFETHTELDEFCVKVKTECVDIEDLFPSEWTLLKSFDRAFWLRYLKDEADERYKPIPPTEEDDDGSEFCTGCPFKDPRLTMSYC